MICSETEALRLLKTVRKACTPESFVIRCEKKLFDKRDGVPRERYASKSLDEPMKRGLVPVTRNVSSHLGKAMLMQNRGVAAADETPCQLRRRVAPPLAPFRAGKRNSYFSRIKFLPLNLSQVAPTQFARLQLCIAVTFGGHAC